MSGTPRLDPSKRNWTLAKPDVGSPETIGSEARAVRLTVPKRVAEGRGEVMETVGLVVSVGGIAKEQDAVLPPFEPRQDQRY